MAGEGDPGTITALGRTTTSPDGSKLRHVIRLDVDDSAAVRRVGTLQLDERILEAEGLFPCLAAGTRTRPGCGSRAGTAPTASRDRPCSLPSARLEAFSKRTSSPHASLKRLVS
jgi:hypothetical protein